MLADLITLAEYRVAAGYDPTNTYDDAKISQWIPFASESIRSFTERDFGAPVVTEQRTFEYDGSGFLDIDDAAEITDVTVDDVSLSSDEWSAEPGRRDDAPVFTYIRLPCYIGWTSGSPEMGFERNLDVYYRERNLYQLPSLIKVTGTWGWSFIPGDIKMSAIWTLQEWLSRPSGEGLSSEAIEGWSRAWGGTANAAMAIPARARDILATYSKIEV